VVEFAIVDAKITEYLAAAGTAENLISLSEAIPGGFYFVEV
jgi:hypothetical protein